MSIKPAFSGALKNEGYPRLYRLRDKKVNERLPEEEYKGSYEAVSRPFKDSYLATKDKRLKDNIHVKEIPYYETSNLSDGVTVYIGSDVEIE